MRLFAVAVALAAAVALCAGLGVALAAGQTRAAAPQEQFVYTVNSTGDEGDASLADGRCATAVGACTLRAALEQATSPAPAATNVAVTVNFNLALPATITLSSPLAVLQNVSIQGPTAGELRLDGGKLTNHFDIGGSEFSGPIAVNIAHLTLVRGAVSGDGGSVYIYAAPNPFDVTFERVVFDDNLAVEGMGGAIVNYGHRVRVSDSRFTNGSAVEGGAIANVGGSLQVARSSFSGNHADTNGGALLNIDGAFPPSDGVMTVTASTLADNNAAGRGGAIYNAYLSVHGVATWIRGSTIVRNAAGSVGGGIYNGWASNLVVNTSIVAANQQGVGTPVPSDCTSSGAPPPGFRPNAIAAPDGFLTGGDNLMGAGASTNCPTSASDVLIDPSRVFTDVLDPQLRSYDGSQPMFALLPGSSNSKNPALDRTTAGSALCGSTALNVDQRGAPKPLGAACDIGAYEAALPQIAVTRTVSLSPNVCTDSTQLELATGVRVFSCATVVNTGNVAFTRTVLTDRASGHTLTLPLPLAPGRSVTLTSRDLQQPDGQAASRDLLETTAGQGVSQFSTPPGVGQEVAGQGTASARPLDVSMTMTAKVFGFGAIRTITTTTTYHQDGAPVTPHKVMGEVTGGTASALQPEETVNGVAVFSYVSLSPLTLANGIVRGNGVRQSLTASPDAVAAMDTVRVWVDLNGNGVWDAFEPMTLAQVPTAIDLASFTAEALAGQGVRLQWRTGSESGVAGFNLHRAAQPDGPYQKVNVALIPSQAAGLGGVYEYTDHPAARGTYYYKLEEVGVDGQTLMHGPVQVIVSGAANASIRTFVPMLGKPGGIDAP